jgi:DNA-binding response OmpR family regulator
MTLFHELKGKRILLIDGDESIRDSMRMFFHNEGLHIDSVETAEEGIELLGKQHYHIIITDCNLPGMDGLQFFKHINKLCPDSFKILMSSLAQDLPSQAADLGVDEYIQKPFSAKLIKDSLSHYREGKK